MGYLGFRRRAGDSLRSEFMSNLIRMFTLIRAGRSVPTFTWSSVFLDDFWAGAVASMGMVSWEWLAVRARYVGVSGTPT